MRDNDEVMKCGLKTAMQQISVTLSYRSSCMVLLLTKPFSVKWNNNGCHEYL